MEQISKSEMELLIGRGILKCVKGKYPGLITGSSQKSGRAKKRWVEEPIYQQLLRIQAKLK